MNQESTDMFRPGRLVTPIRANSIFECGSPILKADSVSRKDGCVCQHGASEAEAPASDVCFLRRTGKWSPKSCMPSIFSDSVKFQTQMLTCQIIFRFHLFQIPSFQILFSPFSAHVSDPFCLLGCACSSELTDSADASKA